MLRGGATPLLFAARVGDVESARLLLKAGADANESQPDGVSALVLAAHSGNGPVGAVLLEHGADPNAFGSGYTALHAAILRSDVNLVKALLARGAKPDVRIAKGTPMRRDTTDWNLPATLIGSTPYLLAARFLEPAIMSALVAGGADPAATLPNGADAVMLAAGMGSSRTASRRGIETIDFGKVEPESRVREAVEAAIALRGDAKAASQTGDTALHVAAALGLRHRRAVPGRARREPHREEPARLHAAGGGDVRVDGWQRPIRGPRRRRFPGVRAAGGARASDYRGAAEEAGRHRVA